MRTPQIATLSPKCTLLEKKQLETKLRRLLQPAIKSIEWDNLRLKILAVEWKKTVQEFRGVGGEIMNQPPLVMNVCEKKSEKFGTTHLWMNELLFDLLNDTVSKYEELNEQKLVCQPKSQPRRKQEKRVTDKKKVWTKLSNGLYAWRLKCLPKKPSGGARQILEPERDPPLVPAKIETSEIFKPGFVVKRKIEDLDFGGIRAGGCTKKVKVWNEI